MERLIGVELRRLSNLTCRYFDQLANKKRVEAITGTNGWIISYIARMNEKGEDVFQRDLEARFGVTRSTASKVVNLMVQKGLIEQQGVPGDKRLKKLCLTERAMEVKLLMDENRRGFEQTLRRGFSDEEIATLFSFLDRLQENLQGLNE
ncbi:MAG: MarR family transcriptional regulator [Clostridia bacterium]|nr:MarR family transcriptional regulator [Clostridia bacterium]